MGHGPPWQRCNAGMGSSGPPRASARRSRAEFAVGVVLNKQLGALPVVAQFCRRLDLAGIVDRLCPMRDLALISHGQVVEALVANRLTSPTPMLHVAGWAQRWAVDEVFGIDPDTLNDDRLARTLDAIAPFLDEIVGSVGAAAIAEFGIDVVRLHWDMTSISLFGAYEQVDEEYPAPKFGHPKDRRTDLRQIQAGIAVSGDGGIPVFGKVYDGGAGEVAQVVAAMKALRKMAAAKDFLLVGDSKLVSYGNVAAMAAAGVAFVAPLAAARVPAGLFAGLDRDAAPVVDYVAGRDTGKAPADRAEYRVIEDCMSIAGPRKSDPPVTLRRVLVHCSANARGQAQARALKLERAADDLGRLARAAGTRHYPTAADVHRRAAEIGKKRRVAAYLTCTIEADGQDKPGFSWSWNTAAIDAEAAADGWYALLTSLDPDQADASEVLIRYKGQPIVERRYSDFKGPLAVAPLFLQHNRRITALIHVICLALLVFCLIERQVRNALHPEETMSGFYPGNQKTRPTGRLIFQVLGRLQLVPARHGVGPQVPLPDRIQTRLLDMLGTDPTRPRWLTP
jgi:transposase